MGLQDEHRPSEVKCRHTVLVFSTGGLYVLCTRCSRAWVAKLAGAPECSKVVDFSAKDEGLGQGDVRVVPGLKDVG